MSQRELQQIASQCVLPGFAGTRLPDWLLRRAADGLAGIELFGGNISSEDQLHELTDELYAANPTAIVTVDEEGGDVTRLEASAGSSWPGNFALGVVADEELTRNVGRSIAAVLSRAGVGVNLAPVADIVGAVDNPVISARSFGKEPAHVSNHVAAFVRGTQSQGVSACVKHFPGHGGTPVDSHVALPVVEGDLRTLEQVALMPFRAAIEAGVHAVQPAHVLVPSYDADNPATTSSVLLNRVLRHELGFAGTIVTDALEMRAISATIGITEAAVRALIAGADAILIGVHDGEARTNQICAAIAAAVLAGRLSKRRLTEAIEHVQRLSERFQRGVATPASVDLGLSAARRAVRSFGVRKLSDPAFVLQFEPPLSAPVQSVRWSFVDILKEKLPGSVGIELDAPVGDTDALLSTVGHRPLILVVRGLHFHRWVADAVDQVLAARPDAVLVEMGLPELRPVRVQQYLVTYGAARVCGMVAAEVLCGV